MYPGVCAPVTAHHPNRERFISSPDKGRTMSREAIETTGKVTVCNAVTGEMEEVERVVRSVEEWRRQPPS